MKEFLENSIVTAWIAPIITGVIVVVLTTIVGKIVSIWWKNRTFIRQKERANEKYINNILPYMIQEINIESKILYSIKRAISLEYQIPEKYMYTNEQLRDQIILNISNTRFMTENTKSRLIKNVMQIFDEMESQIAIRPDDEKIKTKKIDNKYPLICFSAGLVFTIIICAINPEKMDDPNSIVQMLAIFGIIISVISAFFMWMNVLDGLNNVNVEITDNGIVGAAWEAILSIAETTSEVLFGVRVSKGRGKKENDEIDSD